MRYGKFALAGMAAMHVLSSGPAAASALRFVGSPISVRPLPGRGAPGPEAAAGLSFLMAAAAAAAWARRNRKH